jgi:hypothetical protein
MRHAEVKKLWFSEEYLILNVTRLLVAQGHCAGPAASCGGGTQTLSSARHAVVM